MASETTAQDSGTVQDAAAPTAQKFRFSLAYAWYILRRWPLIPGLIMVALVVGGVFADQLAPYDEIEQDIRFRNAPPRIFGSNSEYWSTQDYSQAMFRAEGSEGKDPSNRFLLGGDHVGRDVLSRVIHGARVSLVVTSVALFSGLILGVTIGVLSGYYGGIVDEFLMRMVDVWYAVPFLLLAMVAVIIFEASLNLIIFLLILLAWSGYVRNLRGEVLSLKQRDFVASARVTGASTFRIIFKHLLPGLVNTIFVIASLRVGQLILAEASLSFIGAGIPAPTPAWGVLIAEGREYVEQAWWQTVFPGTAIFLVVLAFNFLGDWVRDRLDPRLRQLD